MRIQGTGGPHEGFATGPVTALPENVAADPGQVGDDRSQAAEDAQQDALTKGRLKLLAADLGNLRADAAPGMLRHGAGGEKREGRAQPGREASHQISLRLNRSDPKKT